MVHSSSFRNGSPVTARRPTAAERNRGSTRRWKVNASQGSGQDQRCQKAFSSTKSVPLHRAQLPGKEEEGEEEEEEEKVEDGARSNHHCLFAPAETR